MSGSPIQAEVYSLAWSRHLSTTIPNYPCVFTDYKTEVSSITVSDTWEHPPSVESSKRSVSGRAAAMHEALLGIQSDGRAFRPLLNAHLAVAHVTRTTLLRLKCGLRGGSSYHLSLLRWGMPTPRHLDLLYQRRRQFKVMDPDFTDWGTAPLVSRGAPTHQHNL